MNYSGINFETLKRKFHSRSVSFTNFKNITIEDIEKMKKFIALKQKSTANTNMYDKSGLTNYINTLRYLTNPTISQELKTFDEKILFLILACDPDLETIETFITSDITPASHIRDEENEKKRKELKNKRSQEIEIFANEVRSKIGFYDENLLKYESILRRGILRKNELESDVKIPSLANLLKRADLVKNLNIINDQNLIRLRSIAERWKNEAKDPTDLNSLAYNLLNRHRDLQIYTVEEQIIVFMLIVDPELDLLKIYEEESTFKKMEARALEELGFYNKGLINVEQQYHDKFEPERKLSAWTK